MQCCATQNAGGGVERRDGTRGGGQLTWWHVSGSTKHCGGWNWTTTVAGQRLPSGSSLANEYLARLSTPHHGPEPSSAPQVPVALEQQWRQTLSSLSGPQLPPSSTSVSQATGDGGGDDGGDVGDGEGQGSSQ